MAENKGSALRSFKRNSLQIWSVVYLHKQLHPFGYCGPLFSEDGPQSKLLASV